jgi:hypothetical protein
VFGNSIAQYKHIKCINLVLLLVKKPGKPIKKNYFKKPTYKKPGKMEGKKKSAIKTH